jgi:hypothetical protein
LVSWSESFGETFTVVVAVPDVFASVESVLHAGVVLGSRGLVVLGLRGVLGLLVVLVVLRSGIVLGSGVVLGDGGLVDGDRGVGAVGVVGASLRVHSGGELGGGETSGEGPVVHRQGGGEGAS